MAKSSPLIWRYVVSVKLMVKISSIFVAFLENMNFNENIYKHNSGYIEPHDIRSFYWNNMFESKF